ncbi:MAG: aminoacyl-histidine dipeptidase [Salinivirgaceae bacterium]|nr:aminoacyl-histidine dipeptidase [Salinivirgaceae bacterium]MDY0280571.1 aminoacyl-histidine dipeptidase [Salinivirgaceae bacterium]
MGVLSGLKPAEVWKYFEEICQIPRPSKKEEKIIEFLKQFGIKHKLNTKVDDVGNILICKPATKGYEDRATIVLQSHMDMVCEKNSDVDFNFETDAIQPYVDGNWVKAKGTTLGADDGIGVAAQLAILASDTIEHGHIECLFTVDEETGLSGAFALQPGFITGKILLNLDSEDEGEVFIGCAGGIDTVATFEYKSKSVPSKNDTFQLKISGLKGGHSGDEINKGLGNSNKIATRFMLYATKHFEARIATFNGGNLRNAIPREAVVIFVVPQQHSAQLKEYAQIFTKEIKNELQKTESNLEIALTETDKVSSVINRKTQRALLHSLQGVWHGVVEMSRDIEGLVETSTNLAAVKTLDNNKILVTTSQRSSIDSQRTNVAQTVASVFKLAEAEVEHVGEYPGWQPNTESPILDISVEAYKKLFGVEPVVRAIHAGLECGLFLEKYPDLDMISFGPTLRDVHSPDERIDIETTQKFWDYLIEIIQNAPKK